MGNLYAKYKTLDKSYYEININSTDLFADEKAKERCFEFIRGNFEKGRKGNALWFPYEILYQEDGKHEHTVSLYLLGKLIHQSCQKPLLSDKINALLSKKEQWYDLENDYDYTWILCCLYHDAASCIENNIKLRYSIKKFKHTIFNYNNKSNENNTVIPRFSQNLIEKYFAYRGKDKKLEHGIYGGYLLFEKLHEAFVQNTKDHNWEENPEKIIGNILYRKEHLDHFAYIADAIICHNIWMSYDEDTNEIYKKKGLEKLIIKSPKDRLSLKEYPLQFILCLLDTIEPVKRFSKLDAKTILENVSIDISNNIIKVGCSLKIREQDEFYQWFGNIHEMEKWLAVEVSPCKCDGKICYKEIKWSIEEEIS